MLKSFKTIKNFYKISGLKKHLVISEFVLFFIPSVLSIVSPVLSASVISSLTVYDYSRAILMLSLDFSIIIVTSLLYFIYHLVSNKASQMIVENLQSYLFTNVKENENINKIHSTTMSNVWLCANFNKTFLFKLCFFIKSLIILGIIIYFKFFIGVIIVAVSFVTFLLLRQTNIKLQKHDAELTIQKQNNLELFNSIQQGLHTSFSQANENSLKSKYFSSVENSISLNKKVTFICSINNNFISLILKATVFALTIYLIMLVKTTAFTLTLYLILIPYLSSSTENLIAFFELFPEIAIIDNALSEFEVLKSKKTLTENKSIEVKSFTLCFSKLELKTSNSLFTLDEIIPSKSVYCFDGKILSKKLIDILMRKEKPMSDLVSLDGKNIFEFSDEQYSQIFYFTSAKPYFYNLSIFENMFLVCENKSKIIKTFKMFALYDEIKKLPDGLNTIINEKISDELIYFLGLVRAFLSGAKIIVLNGVPSVLSDEEIELFKNFIMILKSHCTILFFASQDYDINFNKKISLKN